LGLELGHYNQISNSLHVYESDLEWIRTSYPTIGIANTDSLTFPREQSETYFLELARNIEKVIDQSIPAQEIGSLVRRSNLPTSFRNMLCIICAEGARRRQQQQVISDVMAECTNSLFRHLFNQWVKRCEVGEVSTRSVASGSAKNE
ncbi:MAG: hypothetical protein ACRD8U_13285, partial [Pyrinomonadaceae bacterium]